MSKQELNGLRYGDVVKCKTTNRIETVVATYYQGAQITRQNHVQEGFIGNHNYKEWKKQ